MPISEPAGHYTQGNDPEYDRWADNIRRLLYECQVSDKIIRAASSQSATV